MTSISVAFETSTCLQNISPFPRVSPHGFCRSLWGALHLCSRSPVASIRIFLPAQSPLVTYTQGAVDCTSPIRPPDHPTLSSQLCPGAGPSSSPGVRRREVWSCISSQSTRAALTKGQRYKDWVVSKWRKCLSEFWKLVVQDQDVSMVAFWRGSPSWFLASTFFLVLIWGRGAGAQWGLW